MKTLFLALSLSLGAPLSAQISFTDTTWEQLLLLAKESGKPIFADAYTQWCSPCKWMAAHIFTREDVGQFFNEHFINTKLDMEHGEGILFARAYEADRYPTYLFIDPNGELLHRGLGRMNALEFLELGAAALDSTRQLGVLKRKYEAGDHEPSLLKHYALSLQAAMYGQPESIALAYLHSQPDWATPENLAFITRLCPGQMEHSIYRFLQNNRLKAYQHVAPMEVDEPLKAGIRAKLAAEKITRPDSILMHFQSVFPDKGEQYAMEYELQQLRRSRGPAERQRYLELALAFDAKYHITNPALLNAMGWTFLTFTKEKTLLEKAREWGERALNINDDFAANNLLAALCLQLEDKGAGIAHAEKAIELAEKIGLDSAITESILEDLRKLE